MPVVVNLYVRQRKMTIEHANQIVDRVEALLKSPRPIAQLFYPLSRTGASSREELAHAIFIVVAQVFRAVSSSPQKMADFDTFARSAGSSLWHVLFLQPCLPDWELERISKLNPDSHESIKESIRLSEHAQNDGMMKTEPMESFVSFLRTLDVSSDGYWPSVFHRFGLVYIDPSENRAPACAKDQKKAWWSLVAPSKKKNSFRFEVRQ